MHSITAALAATAIAAASANAFIVIDDFSIDQGPYIGGVFGDTISGDVLSGTRRIFSQNPGGVGDYFTEVSANRLRVTTDNGAQNYTGTYYDGPNREGIPGGFDLSEGGANDRFRFDNVISNGFWRTDMLVKHTDGTFNRASAPGSATNGAYNGSIEILFSDFDMTDDFSSVEWVYFSIDLFSGTNAATSVSTNRFWVVPAPSTAMLLGFAGLTTTRRRR